MLKKALERQPSGFSARKRATLLGLVRGLDQLLRQTVTACPPDLCGSGNSASGSLPSCVRISALRSAGSKRDSLRDAQAGSRPRRDGKRAGSAECHHAPAASAGKAGRMVAGGGASVTRTRRGAGLGRRRAGILRRVSRPSRRASAEKWLSPDAVRSWMKGGAAPGRPMRRRRSRQAEGGRRARTCRLDPGLVGRTASARFQGPRLAWRRMRDKAGCLRLLRFGSGCAA